MTRIRSLLLVPTALALIHCSSSGTADEDDAPMNSDPRLAWQDCASVYRLYADTCASVAVPLAWEDRGGGTIDVYVARRKATTKRTGQLWLLAGGPGQAGSVYTEMVNLIARTLPSLDVYTLDHRGTGRSAPLRCPKEEDIGSPGGIHVVPSEAPSCLSAILSTDASRLPYLTTTQSARDLGMLIERTRGSGEDVFVYGTSYGTYLATRYLQIFSGQPTAVVLDSIVPAGATLVDFDAQHDAVLAELATSCGSDSVCASELSGDPMEHIRALYPKLAAGHCSAAGLDPAAFRETLASLLGNWWQREYILPLVRRLERCDAADVAAIVRMRAFVAQTSIAWDGASVPGSAELVPNASFGLQVHVALSELWPSDAPSAEQVQNEAQASLAGPGVSTLLASLRAHWPVYEPDDYFGKWPVTEVPILMMNGTLDAQTPLAGAQRAHAALSGSNVSLVTIPNAGHAVVAQSPVRTPKAPACGMQILVGFLANRGAPVSNASCLDDLEAPKLDRGPASSRQVWGTQSPWFNP